MNVKTNINTDFTDETIRVITAMCMVNTEGLIIAGSSSMKNINYPNDIDLHQIIDLCYKTKKIAIQELVYYFRKMIANLIRSTTT